MLSKSRRRALIFGVVGVLVLALPCAYCWWIFMGYSVVFRATLPVYPAAREVASALGYWGASTDYQTLYFWTPDSREDVQRYYEALGAAAFSTSPYRTVFNPSGAPVPVITNEFSRELIDAGLNRACYYRLDSQCVEVELIGFAPSEQVVLRPPDSSARDIRTPAPLSGELRGGTLIVYAYFIRSIS